MNEKLKWCQACGEGVTSFCRAKLNPNVAEKCPMGLKERGKPESGSVNDLQKSTQAIRAMKGSP